MRNVINGSKWHVTTHVNECVSRGGRPRLTFLNQVSLKSHDIFNQKAILHVIDANEPLSIANAIGKELKISPVFPWPVTSKMNF